MVIGQEVLKNAQFFAVYMIYKSKTYFFASLKCHDISFWHLSQIHVSYKCPKL